MKKSTPVLGAFVALALVVGACSSKGDSVQDDLDDVIADLDESGHGHSHDDDSSDDLARGMWDVPLCSEAAAYVPAVEFEQGCDLTGEGDIQAGLIYNCENDDREFVYLELDEYEIAFAGLLDGDLQVVDATDAWSVCG